MSPTLPSTHFAIKRFCWKKVAVLGARPLCGDMNSFTGIDLQCIRSDRIVFKDLTFSVKSGETLYLTGPNGSGKSSLLRMLAGLLQPSGGTLLWNGEAKPWDSDSVRGQCHYLGHHNAVKGVLSVRENLSLWSEIISGKVDESALAVALQTFELDRLAELPTRFLSAGQLRRLALARLLASPAALWILDEPATALDTNNEAALQAAINAHTVAGGMVIMATHEVLLEEADVLNMSVFSGTKVSV